MAAYKSHCSKCGELKVKKVTKTRTVYFCSPCVKEYHSKYSKTTKAKLSNKISRQKRRKTDLEFVKQEYKFNSDYKVKRSKVDPIFKLRRNLSSRLGHFIKNIGLNKTIKTLEFLGCSIQDFKQYIEQKFQPGMNWDNYGQWHIDHILPISLANQEQDLLKLNHYTNLQPLWAKDNIKKSNKVNHG